MKKEPMKIIKYYLGTSILTSIAIDGYRRQVRSDHYQFIEKKIKEEQFNTIAHDHLELNHKFITKKIQITTLDKHFTDFKTIQNESITIQSEIDKLKLKNPNM